MATSTETWRPQAAATQTGAIRRDSSATGAPTSMSRVITAAGPNTQACSSAPGARGR